MVTVHSDGSWSADKADYEIDQPLGTAIARYFIRQECETVLDLGCGAGGYVEIMCAHGLWCRGFDLNPRTKEFSERCDIYDITSPMMGFGRYHGVLCMEVGEHVPGDRERQLLDNIKYLCACTAIVSWYPHPGQGIGHINEHPNEWVVEQMNMRGFIFDPVTTADLREAATKHWFKSSLLVFHNQRLKT